jgi:aminopeptidase N
MPIMPTPVHWRKSALLAGMSLALAAAAIFVLPSGAVSPFAPTREYALQNVKVHLSFDIDQHKVMGEVTHSVQLLRSGATTISFDSAGLTISAVTLNGATARFDTQPQKLVITLPHPGKKGEKFEVDIRYTGQPKRGLFFILPDKSYPDRPKEIWSQGEDEDTHYYIPIYDYPNNRTTTEMIVTVPETWITVSNGKLVSTHQEAGGMKTWDWRQSDPMSTYLISIVAGEFVQRTTTWRGMPVIYGVPRGKEDTIDPTFVRTPLMLSLFSDKLGVRYPWVKYAQTAVDDFVVGGMENVSATTLTTRSLINPKLVDEEPQGADGLISHEMAHQWFGDLLTCKDWANLWLNEGFATYYEHLWTEAQYGQDAVDYEFWRDRNNWMNQKRLYTIPIVTRDFNDSLENSGNIYTKGGWVLHMLREKLGDDAYFAAMHEYLEEHRLQNVVTADLAKSVEQATSVNVDEFFAQWIYGAGAPQFDVSYAYDDAAHQVTLTVKQTQKVEGAVGLFHVPMNVQVTTASGAKDYPISISKAEETYSFPADSKPLMVLFDKGDTILKSVNTTKDWHEWAYQLKNAQFTPDRADAAVALGTFKANDEAADALGAAALNDAYWGVRREAADALGLMASSEAEKQLLAALANPQPWVREFVVRDLGHFKNDKTLGARLEEIATSDKAWHVRAAALASLADIQAPDAYDVLAKAVQTDSPDDLLRNAALRGFGPLGDDKAVPMLLDWSSLGKPFNSRNASIFSLARLDKNNPEITRRLISYLSEPYTSLIFPVITALVERGDPSAIAPLEAYLQSGNLNSPMHPFAEAQLGRLKADAAKKEGRKAGADGKSSEETMTTLRDIQKQMEEINERLKKLEQPQGPGRQ